MTTAPCVHCLLYHGHEPTCPRAAPDQRPDDALIREARAVVQDRPTSHYTAYILTRLANALEQRGAELERAKEERDSFQRVGCAAEAEVQRLRDDAKRYRWLLGHAETIRGAHIDWECAYGEGTDWGVQDRTLDAAIDAALRPSSEVDR